MFFCKKKKSVSIVKIIVICAAIASAVAAAVTAVLLWKKKIEAKKLENEEIDAIIDAQIDNCAECEACADEE